MFRRFRIKTALRAEVIRLRGTVDPGGLIRAELLFFEPAFIVADDMRRERWTAEQAMVFMVSDVVLQAARQGNVAAFAQDDPEAHEALRVLYDHVVAKAQDDPMLSACLSLPGPNEADPFDAIPPTTE